MNNKKGFSFSAWVFGVVLMLLLIVIVSTQILSPMNSRFNKNFTIGLDTSAIDEYESSLTTANTQVEGGEVEQSDDGLSLKNAWSITKLIYKVTYQFITGGFVSNLMTNVLNLPVIVGAVARIIFIASLIFIIIYIFMKVKP